MHLPEDKLVALRKLIASLSHRQWCSQAQLESLIGHLHHAAKVVWPGRTFLRRMIDLPYCIRHQDHPIRLNSEFHPDMRGLAQEKNSQQAPLIDALVGDRMVFAWCHKIN